MDNRNPKIWARVDPAVRERIRTEAAQLFDGNESMLVRRAVVRFLDDIEDQRRRAAGSLIAPLIDEREEAAVA